MLFKRYSLDHQLKQKVKPKRSLLEFEKRQFPFLHVDSHVNSELMNLAGSQNPISFVQIETQASDAKSDAEMVLGSFVCLVV